MVNEERVRLMTHLAVYESKEGKEDLPITQYYRLDYISVELLKTFFSSTLAFGIIVVLHIFYRLQEWTDSLYTMDYLGYAKHLLIQYVIFVLVYQVIGFIFYNLRYGKSSKRKKLFQERLKKVRNIYETEEKRYASRTYEK